MQSILQILKLNDPRSGTKDGRPWSMQDAECLLLNDDGSVSQVGVLQLPRELVGKVETGTYIGTFALRPDFQTRRIGAVLTGITPYAVQGAPVIGAPPKAPSGKSAAPAASA